MTVTVTLRIQSIRSQNPFGRGGCISIGTEISDAGDIVDAKSYYVIKVTGSQLGDAVVQPGQWWRVSGTLESFSRMSNGRIFEERQIVAKELALLRVSGEHIVTYLADSPEFVGVGMVKARKLWDKFGERLYKILDDGDVEALSEVLTLESSKQVSDSWTQHGKTRTLQWLQDSGISVRVGRKLIAYFGSDAQAKLEEDPYRLLSFEGSWKAVDAFARGKLGISEDDPRRIQAAVEEALYRTFDSGDTVTPMSSLLKRVEAVLGGPEYRGLAMAALESGLTNGSYVIGANGNVHLLGALVMERTVARSVAARLRNSSRLLNEAVVDNLILEYEKAEGFTLNEEQRQAVQCASENSMALILGGAGVGKTTVLKALFKVYEAAGVSITQMALSGRAAKRMAEATGLQAWTIARFFKNVQNVDFERPSVVVVDEASMLDIITMHRLCECLPPHVRLLLVGDTSQLMPVGPGLVLHALAQIPEVPMVELTQVRRYGGPIAAAALDIRAGRWPNLPADGTSPISFVPCRVAEIPEVVVALYESDREITQILSARKGNADGVKNLNLVCQSRFAMGKVLLTVHNDEFNMPMSTGFHLGDPVLCTRNLWDQGLQNGSLGIVTEIEAKPRQLQGADGTELGKAVAWVQWDDGGRRPVFASMLEDLELGYALTVHKAQGSQWQRVIVVLTGSRLLDRTLIYTAITRAQKQVIIIGDEVAAREAVEALPKAELRQVGLTSLLKSEFAANAEQLRALA